MSTSTPTTGAEARPAGGAAVLVVALALAALGSGAAGARATPQSDGPAPASRAMAVTVDDLPSHPSSDLEEMRRITDGVLAALRQHGASAVGFVNESKLEPAGQRAARLGLLRAWLEAGHDLGNHTHSHPDLQRVPLEDYERDVLRRLAARGYRFVSLGEALADEAWRTPDEYVGPRGPSWLFRFRVAKGLPLGLEREPDPPTWVLDLYRAAQERR